MSTPRVTLDPQGGVVVRRVVIAGRLGRMQQALVGLSKEIGRREEGHLAASWNGARARTMVAVRAEVQSLSNRCAQLKRQRAPLTRQTATAT
jgi:hypothetical protein